MNIDEFMKKMASQTAPMQKNDGKMKKKIEKISLNFDGNFGRYQILPMNDIITDYPFVKLDNTREICVPRKQVAMDGTESVYSAWIKLLPKAEGYRMKDSTGRVTSSLTSEEDQLLSEAYILFDQLYNEIDAKTNINISRNLIRKRNYTIFNAYCINKWDFDPNKREPVRSKFSGLFVSTAKGFVDAVEEDIKSQAVMNDGDLSWVNNVYNRQLSNRDGFMMFNISRNKGTSPGYTVSVNHKVGAAKTLQGYVISEEDAELMQDPIEEFLGWQAKKTEENENLPIEQRRYFNAELIREAISFMTQQLAAVRAAKETNTSIEEAIKITNETAFGNSPAAPANMNTNDPMLQQQQKAQQQPVENNYQPEVNNNSPFQTPPAAHINPLTSTPVNNNAGFGGNAGGFGGFGGFGSESNGFGNDLPFQN